MHRGPRASDGGGTDRVGGRVAVLLVVVCLAALAGCLSVTDDAPGTPTDGPGLPDGAVTEASVSAVVDGDTIGVSYDDGRTDDVRLVGVDAPETRGSTNPDEFEGVPNTTAGRACLADAGGAATSALTDRLLAERVDLVRDPGTDERGYYDRLLAVIGHDGANVNYWLVERGHARVYDSSFTQAESFYAAEETAREADRGLWACTDPGSAVADGGLRVRVQADAPGDDRENPNGEFVVLANPGEDSLAIGGWTVSDEAGRSYEFPANASIPGGGEVRLYSGAGADGPTAFYWDQGAVWNNDGDTATVRAENGTVVAEESY